MTFLNALLLFGAATAAAPLLIHLLHKSKFRVVDWGAMQFLESVFEENRRRLQFHEWLLLLIRCLIPIVLAICMARPLIKSPWAGSDQHMLVVVDDTVSMGSRSPSGQRYADLAETRIDQLLTEFPQRRFHGFLMGGSVQAFDLIREEDDWKERIAPKSSSLSPTTTLIDILNRCERIRGGPHQIILLSDFQNDEWLETPAANYQQVRSARDANPLKPSISLLSLRANANSSSQSEITPRQNAFVQSLRSSTNQWIPGQTVVIEAELANQGSNDVAGIKCTLQVEHQAVESQVIDIPAQSQLRVRFEYIVPQAMDADEPNRSPNSDFSTRWFPYAVEIESPDDLLQDNIAHAVAKRARPVPVGLVGGFSGAAPLASNAGELDATSFLRAALTPFSAIQDPGAQGQDAIEVDLLSPRDLESSRLTKYEVLVFADLGTLDAQQKNAVDEFLGSGKGMLIFSGPAMVQAAEFINEQLCSENDGWFPGRIDPAMELANGLNNVQGSNAAIQVSPQRFEHPALRFANRQNASTLTDALVYRSLAPPVDGDSISEENRPLARLESGSPLIIEGREKVIWFTSSADPSWNDLALRPAFLPLVQNIVHYLADDSLDGNTFASGAGAQFQLPDGATPPELGVVGPDGNAREYQIIDENDKQLVRFADNRSIGTYELQMNDQVVGTVLTPRPPVESDPELVSPTELERIADSIGGVAPMSFEDLITEIEIAADGREVWRWFWWAFIGLLVLERMLVWFMGRLR